MWITLKTKYGEHEPSDKPIQLDDAEANVLIKAGQAVKAEEPKAVTDATEKASAAIIDRVSTETAKKVMDLLSVQSAEGKGAKVPGYGQSADIKVGADRCLDDPKFGFKSFGEQVHAVEMFYKSRQQTVDERLNTYIKVISNGGVSTKGPTTYANEGLGADGGFLLAPNFAQEILRFTFADESLLGRCRMFTTSSNNLIIPKDETTPWGGTGVQVFWAAEAAALTQTKPKIGQDNLVLQKLTAFVPVTNEQLADSFMGLGQYISLLAGERIRWKADDALVNGTGAGMPLGILKSGALVTQAAETGQATQTINISNIAKMISRIPAESLKSLVWLVHPSAYPQLVLLTNGNQSLYIAPGEVDQKAGIMGRLMGIPLVISQHCQGVGTAGDIYLLDLSKYLVLTKGTGIESAFSMHLYFDVDASVFRFTFRLAGQPWLSAPITSAYGSYQLSPFVNLAGR